MSLPKCEKCGRQLEEGDDAYVNEFKKIDIKGTKVDIRLVKEYTCAPKCPKGGK